MKNKMPKLKTIRWIGCSIILAAMVYVTLSAFKLTNNYDIDTMKHKKIIAHRGGADLGPENSLYCIEQGIKSGADMVEIDIHLSKDGEIIVCHDPKINRTTNGKGYISSFTLNELKQFYLKDKEGNITNEKLPTIQEVINLTKGKCGLLIEIKKDKSSLPGIENKLLNIIQQNDAYNWTTVQSFDDSVLKNFHELDNRVRLEKLLVFKFIGLPYIYDGSIKKLDYNKYSYIQSFNMMQCGVNTSIVDNFHSHGKEVKIWTLKEPNKKSKLHVDGIITDRPDLWKH